MELSLIAAIAENGVIGKDNDLIWRLPDDLKYFKQVTSGHPIIMGRKNYESIGRPLPNRLNIVMTRRSGLEIAGCEVVSSLDSAIKLAADSGAEKAFIIGGGEIYKMSLDIVQELHITHVHQSYDGDVSFPDVDWSKWNVEEVIEHPVDDRHAASFTIKRYLPKQ